MANRKVQLLRYVKTDAGWRRLKVNVRGNNPTSVAFNGSEMRFSAIESDQLGDFQLKYRNDGRVIYRPIGTDGQDAVNQWRSQIDLMDASNKGVPVTVPVDDTRLTIRKGKELFLEERRHKGRDEEHSNLISALIDIFIEVSGKVYVDNVEKRDLLRLSSVLRERGLAPHTVKNRFGIICSFLRHCGIDPVTNLKLTKDDKPRVTKKSPEAYTPDEVDRFLAACRTDRDRLLFKFFLKTGCRYQEVMYATWGDVNFEERMFRVREKRDLGFQPKDHEEREIPIVDSLLQMLRDWRKEHPTWRFVFQTSSGRPMKKMLTACKRIAYRAGLNCGTCQTCAATKAKECKRWFLHRFRATTATWGLQNGMSLLEVQAILGHSDLKTTRRYLAPQRGLVLRSAMNRAFNRPESVVVMKMAAGA